MPIGTFLLFFIKYSVYLPPIQLKKIIMMSFVLNMLFDGNGLMILMILALVLIFWFFILAPQQNQKKEEEKFLNSMKTGDKVVTIGGIHGTIADMDDQKVLIQMMYSDAQLLLEKQAISPEATKNRYQLPAPPKKKKKGAKGKSQSASTAKKTKS